MTPHEIAFELILKRTAKAYRDLAEASSLEAANDCPSSLARQYSNGYVEGLEHAANLIDMLTTSLPSLLEEHSS